MNISSYITYRVRLLRLANTHIYLPPKVAIFNRFLRIRMAHSESYSDWVDLRVADTCPGPISVQHAQVSW
jgi:hypothetical protein